MASIHRYAVALALVVVAAVSSLLVAPDLPAEVAVHWNAADQADGFAPRWVGLWLLPALGVAMTGLFAALPRTDPLGENIQQFRVAYDYFAVLTVAFLTYVHGIVLAMNLGYDLSVLQAVTPAVAALYVGVGVVLDRAGRNWFVGVRTPWTLSDDQVWDRTHDRAATLFKTAGVLALGGLLVPAYATYFLVVPPVAVSLYATGYSYLAYRRLNRSA